MQTESHPVRQEIMAVQTMCDAQGNPMDFEVGNNGVTRIEACEKNGEYCMIPYIRVWAGDACIMECSQHKVGYILFKGGAV